MRQEGAAGPAATVTYMSATYSGGDGNVTVLTKPVKFSRTKSGLPLLIPDGWTGTYEQALQEAAMGKKRKSKAQGKAAAKAKAEKKQPKKRGK